MDERFAPPGKEPVVQHTRSETLDSFGKTLFPSTYKPMKLGHPEISLNVADLKKSIAFYSALGFREVEGDKAGGWLVVEQTGIRIGLYQEIVERNSITFFGGDVEAIAGKVHENGLQLESGPVEEEDGSTGAKILDPDGNLLYFNS